MVLYSVRQLCWQKQGRQAICALRQGVRFGKSNVGQPVRRISQVHSVEGSEFLKYISQIMAFNASFDLESREVDQTILELDSKVVLGCASTITRPSWETRLR